MKARTKLQNWLLCVLFSVVMSCTVAAGKVIYVDAAAVGANDGSSWTDAYSYLQDALLASSAGDEIRVAQGIYTPTQDPLDRDATFDLKNGVSITGGYAGLAAMYPDFRHIKFFTTILSGDIDNNDDRMDPNTKEGNSHHVVTCTGQGNTAVLEGVTITGGYSNMTGERGHHSEFGAGGGLYCQSACSPQLIDCVFTDNYAQEGGAVSLPNNYGLIDEDVSDEHSWKPIFIRCIFTNNNNVAVSIGVRWHPEFIDCLFENNNAGYYGGAISSESLSTIKFNRCVFRRNSAGERGGAIYTSHWAGTAMQFDNCLFENNNAESHGGVISSWLRPTLQFNHCVFRRNSAGITGGAIDAPLSSEIRIVNCLFVTNTAGGFGGAISCPDATNGSGDSLLNLVNCTFYGNSSPTFHKPPTNSAKNPDGSRVYWSGSVITNCIFYNSIANEVSEIPVSFEFGRKEPLIITSIYEKRPQEGIVPPTPDPLFVDPNGADGILGTKDDDFHLTPGSPAIDSGTNETEPPLPAMDLDGNPRILNDIVDLGAYEFTGLNNIGYASHSE